MDAYKIILDILLVILPAVGIIFLVYLIFLVRRLLITVKKADYLIEDLTFKIENLNATLATINKVNSYFNLAETIAKRNIKSSIKFVAKNRDLAYKALDYVKNILNSSTEDDESLSAEHKD